MSGNRRAACDYDEITEHRRTSNRGMGNYDAMTADDDVVPQLYEIINFRALADDSIVKSAAVDGSVGADFDVVLNDHATDLRHFEVTLRPHREAESVLADRDTRVE